MVEISDNIYSAFGVFGFIIIGMGWFIRFLIQEKKIEHEEILEERKENLEVLREMGITIKALETWLKAKS